LQPDLNAFDSGGEGDAVHPNGFFRIFARSVAYAYPRIGRRA
jgi:hypothetical protein